MGDYSYFYLGNFCYFESRNSVIDDIIFLFRQQDKIITRSSQEIPLELYENYEEIINEYPEFNIVIYRAPINVVIDRLNILGYNLDNAKEAFKIWISYAQNENNKHLIRLNTEETNNSKLLIEQYQLTNRILQKLTPETWIQNLQEIISSGLSYENGVFDLLQDDSIINYMLSRSWFGFPGDDILIPLRLSLDLLKDNEELIYDITELVDAQYINLDDDFVYEGFHYAESEFISKSKIIVLTEGKTDAWILSESLKILYPHLVDYFSFLDFESSRFGGGVGNLINVVKAFAGAGIVNNIIALFDNDTAAIAACNNLDKKKLPSNIVIKYLPEIDLLKEYPTIGPSGTSNLNVNGMAASIELYLGKDVLQVNGKNLTPIQWIGYNQSVNQYQGEVLNKSMLHDRFREKLTRAEKGENLDWEDLKKVFLLIFSSFSDKNQRIICKYASDRFE